MIIEDLIRMGRPLLEGGMESREVLKLVSDAESETTKNFYRHVFVAELAEHSESFVSHQVWGQEMPEKKRTDFKPDVKKTIGAPFVLPKGGNQLHPQGFYGVGVYPCYDKHIQRFRESSQNVTKFLLSRLKKTPSLQLSKEQVDEISAKVRQYLLEDTQAEKGVLVIADTRGENAPYHYMERLTSYHFGRSHIFPEKYIHPNFERILELFWEAKILEGAEKGEREGMCSFCGDESRLVTAYCKAWPWYLPTWTCPLPNAGSETMLVEGIAACPACYKALVYGACLFGKLTRRVQSLVIREIFSPVNNQEGKNLNARKEISKLPNIQGSGLLLPLLDTSFDDPEIRQEFAENVQQMLSPPDRKGSAADRHILAVTGFELFLPDGADKRDYRLSLIYFSGDTGKGDIHLRSYIEDVVPSTISLLRRVGRQTAETAVSLLRDLFASVSREQEAFYNTQYSSVPFLLTRAYGGPYLWDQLQAVLHRRSLALSRPLYNIAERLRSVTPRYPDSLNEIREEVVFYLSFLDFLTRYQKEVLKNGGPAMAMRPLKELLKVIFDEPVETFRLESPDELGFACGAVIRQFSRQYYVETQKDYLKQRVMTFGSDLTPQAIWKRGVKQIFEVAARFPNLDSKIGEVFRRRVGLVLKEYDRLHEEIQGRKDEFMAAFWSGYCLQGFDRPKGKGKSEADEDDEN